MSELTDLVLMELVDSQTLCQARYQGSSGWAIHISSKYTSAASKASRSNLRQWASSTHSLFLKMPLPSLEERFCKESSITNPQSGIYMLIEGDSSTASRISFATDRVSAF